MITIKTSVELEWLDNIQHLAIMHIVHSVIKQGIAITKTWKVIQ